MGNKKDSKLKRDTTEPVRVDKGVVNLVRAQSKQRDGLRIGQFFEVAAMDKLEKLKIKNADKV